jgi:hypothetical protein
MKKLLGIVVLGLLWCNTTFALPKCQGEDISKWTMCEGIKTTFKDSKYVGEFKDGKYHGQGTITNSAGDKYTGGWKDGKYYGKGTLTYFNGDKKKVVVKDGKFYEQKTLTSFDQNKKKEKKIKIRKKSKNWQPSLRGNCDPYKNVSPSLKYLTKNLTSVQIDPSSTNPFSPKITVLEPSIIFKDGTFTLLKRINKKMTVLESSARNYWVYELNQTINKNPQLYDDGTHGDLVANDGVYTRSCLSLAIPEINNKIVQYGHLNIFLDSSLRNTETVTKINNDLSMNDTGFFITVGNSYKKKNMFEVMTRSSKSMQAVWKAKGSVFDIFLLTPRNRLQGGGGMYRVHDFIQGLGHKPRCKNYSHCRSFVDGLKHPELIGVIYGGDPIMSGGTLTHEIEHAVFGINSRENFPRGNKDSKNNKKFLLTNEWSLGDGHIEADVIINTTLKNPLYDPARGAPHTAHLKVGKKVVETHFVKDGSTFKLKERTAKDYQLSDIFLYMLGVIEPHQVKEIYYKLVNYRLHGCKTVGLKLVCTNDKVTFDEAIPFKTQDFINKFGKYSNPRFKVTGGKSFDPKNINLGILNYSDRKHTDAEITLKSIHYRSYAKGNGPTIKYENYVPSGDVYGGYIWSYVTKGKSNINIDFTKKSRLK